MTFSYEDQSPQVNTRLSPDLRDKLEQFSEAHDVPKSEIMRQALRQFLPIDEDDPDVPRDPALRESYLWLRERTDDRGRLSSSDAVNGLAQYHSMEKQWIKSSRLEPLENRGWITGQFHAIDVHDEPRR